MLRSANLVSPVFVGGDLRACCWCGSRQRASPYPARCQLVPCGVEAVAVAGAEAWAVVEANAVALALDTHGDCEVVASGGADNAQQLLFGWGRDYGALARLLAWPTRRAAGLRGSRSG